MHSFAKKAPLAGELLQDNNLRDFINNAALNAQRREVIDVYSTDNFKANDEVIGSAFTEQWSPEYFGAAVEFLAECFFEEFGARFDLEFDFSVEDYDSADVDKGIDHYAKSIRQKRILPTRETRFGSPVYIQTKGTLNPRKEFKTNDGARLPNFFMAAQAEAMNEGYAYQARYVLFTTGKGLHYKLNENSGKICEVINYNTIRKYVDGNVEFWNTMRRKMSISEQSYKVEIDVEAGLVAEDS